VDSGVSASQKYGPEIHSVMMTRVLRSKVAFPYRCIRAYALAVDDDGGLRGGARRGCFSQHFLRVTAPEASRYLVCQV